jgi:hypothetical protein
MRISGAGQADYNGDFAITVTGANTFTYTVANSPATPATGTITSKVAPVDWTKPFSGTNIAAYKQGAGSNGMYLRINDVAATGNSLPPIRGYENMTDINTGTGAFPTDTQYGTGAYSGIVKAGGGPSLGWCIIGNEKLVHIITSSGTPLYGLHSFGDIASRKNGDQFNTIITANFSGNYIDQQSVFVVANLANDYSSINGHFLARSYAQSGTAVSCGKQSGGMTKVGGGSAAYPCPVDNALHIAPIFITESAGIRGTLTGLWNPMHYKPFTTGDVIAGSGEYAGKMFMAYDLGSNSSGNTGQVLLEISNTW